MIGQLIDERYQLIKLTGSGVWGQTYLATDTRRPGSPQCVVKQLRLGNHNAETQKMISVLFQEKAETIDKLSKHDRIPSLLAYFQEDKDLYLVEDYVIGEPLTQELVSGQPLSEEQVILLLEEVLEILAFVHGNRAIHGKIKPGNLLRRTGDNKLVLLGFGLEGEIKEMSAQEGQLPTEEESKTEKSTGTTAIYKPESNGKVTPNYNSDIYGLGIIAIQALSGLSRTELVKLKQTEDGPQLEISWRDRSECSPELADIIDKMVDYQSENRYWAASEVLADLRAKLPERNMHGNYANEISPPNATQEESVLETKKFHKTGLWIALGLVASMALGGLAIYWWQNFGSSKGKGFFDRAQELAQQGDNPGAIAFYDRAIALAPQDAELYYQRGNARLNQGERQEAIADYTEAIKLQPNYGNAYYNRGLANYAMGNHGNAIADFAKVLELNPDDADAYHRRGLSYYETENYKLAIKDYSTTIRLQPKNADAYTSRGLAKAMAGDKPGALSDYTEALKLSPNDARIYYNRSRARFHLADYRGAVEDAKKAIDLKPNDADAYVNRCSAYLNLEEYSRALADCTKAIALNPKDEEAYNNRCIARLNMGEYQRAAEDCSITIGINSDSAKAYSNRGLARFESGDRQGAIEDFTAAIRLNPSDAVAYSNRGSIYSEQGDYAKAIEDFAQAVRLNPTNASAYYNRGSVRARLGDQTGAIEDLRKSGNLFLEQGRVDDYQKVQKTIDQVR